MSDIDTSLPYPRPVIRTSLHFYLQTHLSSLHTSAFAAAVRTVVTSPGGPPLIPLPPVILRLKSSLTFKNVYRMPCASTSHIEPPARPGRLSSCLSRPACVPLLRCTLCQGPSQGVLERPGPGCPHRVLGSGQPLRRPLPVPQAARPRFVLSHGPGSFISPPTNYSCARLPCFQVLAEKTPTMLCVLAGPGTRIRETPAP